MKESFTIDELKEFLKEVKERGNYSQYIDLEGKIHNIDTTFFYRCMEYFLQDLQIHLDEINKPELDRIKAICSYKDPIEALNHLWEHIDQSYINSLTVIKIAKDQSMRFDNYGSIGHLTSNTGTDFDKEHTDSDWTNKHYYAHYDEKENALIFFVYV